MDEETWYKNQLKNVDRLKPELTDQYSRSEDLENYEETNYKEIVKQSFVNNVLESEI